jgi:hypothetical protein
VGTKNRQAMVTGDLNAQLAVFASAGEFPQPKVYDPAIERCPGQLLRIVITQQRQRRLVAAQSP